MMRSNPNTKIIMIALFIIVLSPIFNSNLNYKYGNSDKINLDNENLKISGESGKIHINGNSGWSNAKTAGIVTGSGNSSDPYVIEDLIINGGGSGSCLFIENSDVNFRIENCTLYNSGNGENDAGIKLSFANNGSIVNNTSYDNTNGIWLSYSHNNTVIRNILSDDNKYGIYIEYSHDNLFYLNNIGGIIHTIFFRYSTHTFHSLKKMLYTYHSQNFTSYLGNYWSDYDKFDRDNDGLGDWSYKVLPFETGYTLYDYYPLMEPIWNYEVHKFVESIPDITIHSPMQNEIFRKTSPEFNISIDEEYLVSTWYTIEGIAGTFSFTELIGKIDQGAWTDATEGEITITFFALDRAGNTGSESVTVIKSIPSQPAILGYNMILLIGVFSLISVILIKRQKH
ncbi:MAG: NosD domain-containing protein [Promethearchaeota archaeon]